MPNVTFEGLELNRAYDREFLVEKWGYKGIEAISKGLVTPAAQPYIILFVTHEKQKSATPYKDRLDSGRLFWEGPRNHLGEKRILNAASTGEEIHLFYRDRHHSDFIYYGELSLEEATVDRDGRSHFVFQLLSI